MSQTGIKLKQVVECDVASVPDIDRFQVKREINNEMVKSEYLTEDGHYREQMMSEYALCSEQNDLIENK